MSTHSIQWQTWDLADESDRRFRRLCLIVGIPLLILSAIIPFLELVGLTRGGGTLAGSRYVEFLPEQPAPVAEKVEEPKPAEVDEPEPEEVKAEPTPEPRPEPPKAAKPVEVPPEVVRQRAVERARETAQRSGVMAFASQLSALHTGVAAIEQNDQALSELNTGEGANTAGAPSSGAFEQAAAGTSGGIGSATGSGQTRRTQAGTGLGQRRTTVVESPVGFGEDRSRPGQGGDKLIPGRTLEEIQLTFDRNKGAFYAIFNRAMRDNPNLGAGKVVVSITIAPSGAVTDCKLVSSTFNDADLERKVVQRVMLLNFGAKSVPPFTYPNYPINFLPS